jgi:hypothetical protein
MKKELSRPDPLLQCIPAPIWTGQMPQPNHPCAPAPGPCSVTAPDRSLAETHLCWTTQSRPFTPTCAVPPILIPCTAWAARPNALSPPREDSRQAPALTCSTAIAPLLHRSPLTQPSACSRVAIDPGAPPQAKCSTDPEETRSLAPSFSSTVMTLLVPASSGCPLAQPTVP